MVGRTLAMISHRLMTIYRAAVDSAGQSIASIRTWSAHRADDVASKTPLWPACIARSCGAGVAWLGLTVLIAWALNIDFVKSVLPGFEEMKANAALCFLFSGLALRATASPGCRLHNVIRYSGILLIIAIGSLTVVEYLSGSNLGIDELLFADPAASDSEQLVLAPGRMALVTAVAFFMAGFSMLLLRGRATVVAQLLACAVALTALFSLATYLWRPVEKADDNLYISLALNTAFGFTVLAIGLLAAAPPRGPVAVLMSATRGGALARLLLPTAIGGTLFLGALAAAGQRAGWYETAYGTSLFVLSTAAVLAGFILFVAHRASLSELAAQDSEQQFRQLHSVLEQRVGERTEELTESDRFTQSTLDALSAHISILDEQGCILATNRTWREFALANAAKTEVGVGANYLQTCDRAVGLGTEEASIVAAGIRAVIRGQQTSFALEYPCHGPSEKRWFIVRATRFSGDGPVRVVIAHENVTAARLADEERQKFVSLAENSIDFISLTKLSGEVIYTNAAARELVGLDDTSRQGVTKFRDFFTEQGQLDLQELNRPAMLPAGRWKGELQLQNFRTGQPVETDSSIFIVRNPASDQPICMAIVARDITERKLQEEELRKSQAVLLNEERRYRSLVQATSAIVWETPASGEFESEQPGWSNFTGQSFEQLRGWGWLTAVHPDDRPNTAAVWSAAFNSHSVYQVEHRLRRHDGVYRQMMVRAVPIADTDGTIYLWVGIHTDIEILKRAEAAERVARESADSANRAKSEFLANMSHEIRTPMNGIIGLTGLTLNTTLTAEQKEYLEGVMLSAESLLTLINSILDFSKIEAGKMELEQSNFELRKTLMTTMKVLSMRARQQNLELNFDVRPDVPDALIGDSARLGQVIINLVGNALKFTHQGKISVLAELDELLDDAVRLRFTVSDTGVGIPTNRQEAIFQPFMQADTSTTRRYGGSGLGLSISAQLVQLMGGRTWFESTEGSGSDFHFTAIFGRQLLPGTTILLRHAPDSSGLNEQMMAQPVTTLSNVNPRVPAESVTRRLHILVAEDNSVNQLLARRTLEKAGHSVVVANNGQEAVAAVNREKFDLVLMDVQMPVMDGFQATARIREQEEKTGKHLPIVAMTAHALIGDRERCLQADMDGYIAKPFRNSELFSVIATAVNDNADSATTADKGLSVTP